MYVTYVIIAALSNRAGHYIFLLWFLLLSIFFFFSSPILSRRRLDIYHTSTWCVLSAILRCRSEMCCIRLAENAGRKSRQNFGICAPSHNFVKPYLRN